MDGIVEILNFKLWFYCLIQIYIENDIDYQKSKKRFLTSIKLV